MEDLMNLYSCFMPQQSNCLIHGSAIVFSKKVDNTWNDKQITIEIIFP